MTKIWRERLHTIRWTAFGLLLIATLIWSLLQTRGAKPRPVEKTTAIALLLPQPPPPPPPPKKIVPQRVAKTPPTVPTPSPLPPRPKAVTAPKSTTPAVDKPLAMDTPLDSNPYQIPQGTAEGDAIGGGGNGGSGFTIGGGGGGGGGCSGIVAKSYLGLVNSQIMQVFKDRSKTGNRDFQIQAQLWFGASGNVRQSELVDSTGDASLDASITQVLGEVNIGSNVPQCMQPVKVRVSEPWTGSFGDTADKQAGQTKREQSETLIWKQPARP